MNPIQSSPINIESKQLKQQSGIIEINGKQYRIKKLQINGQEVQLNQGKIQHQPIYEKIQQLSQKVFENSNTPVDKNVKLSFGEKFATVDEKHTAKLGETESKLVNEIKNKGSEILQVKNDREKFLEKHTFTKDVPGNLKSTAIKVGTIALAIIASPILLPLAITINVGKALADAYTFIKDAILKTNNLKTASETMKATEEKSKFDGMKKVYNDFLEDIRSENNGIAEFDVPNISGEDTRKTIATDKIERFISIILIKENQTKFSKSEINELAKQFAPEDLKSEESFMNKFNQLPGKYSSILEVLEKSIEDDLGRVISESKGLFSNPQDNDKKLLEHLKSLFEKEPKNGDYATRNMEITSALRALIRSETYQAIKQDSGNNYVKLVSRLSSGIWNNVEAFSSYHQFGKTLLENVDTSEIYQKNQMSGKERREILEAAHKKGTQDLYTFEGIPNKILYAFKHPRQVLGSIASEGGVPREIASAFGLGTYDSHGELRNNPSLQGVTEITLKDGKSSIKGKVNNCYGGSPTIGDSNLTDVSPEFHAVCQAVENNWFAKDKDPKIPNKIYYTNLQNIENKHGEGERSFAIMNMNRRYPLAFLGMTLSKDSDFYRMKGEYKDAKWTTAQDFGQEMTKIFNNDTCYQYGNRTKTKDEEGNYIGGFGIYLPGKKEDWMRENGLIPNIINEANTYFSEVETNLKKEHPDLDDQVFSDQFAKSLRGAYQEYVYSMIQAVTEVKLVREASHLNGVTEPTVMAIRACKENIDRGGAENAKYLHTRLNNDAKQDNNLIVGALESRALSARNRTILDDRLPEVLSFIEHVNPSDFKDHLENILKSQGLELRDDQSLKFTPAT